LFGLDALALETDGAGKTNVFLTFVKRVGKSPGSGSSAKGFGNVVSAAEGDGRVEDPDIDTGRSDVSTLSASVMVIVTPRLMADCDKRDDSGYSSISDDVMSEGGMSGPR